VPRTSKVKRQAPQLAKKIPPGFIRYLDPNEVERPPSGEAWAHEIKWDGYRAQAHLTEGRGTIYTRNGNDWTARFGPIAPAVELLPARTAIIDGEAVAIDRKGAADFHELRRQLGQAHGKIIYKAFDLLWLDGEDLRPLAWSERKRRLQDLFDKLPPAASDVLNYAEPLHQDGATVYASVCRLGLEGIVSKRIDAPYRAGRSDAWRKTRCARSETFAVVGFSENSRGRLDGLYLARGEKGSLVYAGSVEKGFGAGDLRDLETRLRPLFTRKSPLTVAVRKPKARWVRPAVLVEVAYPNASADGRLRHPSFKGFRDDIEPAEYR
jgi:bifunctional non-homologous end joining protein LigD